MPKSVLVACFVAACSSSSADPTSAGGGPATGGNGGSVDAGAASGSDTGAAAGMSGASGQGGTGGTGSGGSAAGGTGSGGSPMGGAGGSGGGPTVFWDVCNCSCTCEGGSLELEDDACKTTDLGPCSCEGVCEESCPTAGYGALVSQTGACTLSETPILWTCGIASFGSDDGCDCGCGAIDPDCASAASASCAGCDTPGSCATSCAQVAASDNTTCEDVPSSWTCSPAFFGRADGCDCGCGALDTDCINDTLGACDFCNSAGSCARGCNQVLPESNYVCSEPDVPPGWTCLPSRYGTGDGCDCGCGIVDPDCLDATRTSCEHCVQTGSCAIFYCDDIDLNDNSACVF